MNICSSHCRSVEQRPVQGFPELSESRWNRHCKRFTDAGFTACLLRQMYYLLWLSSRTSALLITGGGGTVASSVHFTSHLFAGDTHLSAPSIIRTCWLSASIGSCHQWNKIEMMVFPVVDYGWRLQYRKSQGLLDGTLTIFERPPASLLCIDA